MSKKITKKYKLSLEEIDKNKEYSLKETFSLIKSITQVKFDASVDIDVHLGVDPRRADQMVRGTVILPHGRGKKIRILVLCSPERENEAERAGADYAGLEEYIKKIEQGWIEIDVIVAIPAVMAKVGRLGKILGPRGLMPNPKSGTVTDNIGKAIHEIKAGKIDFKVDKFGIIHLSIGKVSFDSKKLEENTTELMRALSRLKPTAAKGIYFKSIHVSSTMSPSIKIKSIL